MTFGGDQWGRPQPPPPQQQAPERRRGIGPIGCYFVLVGFLAVCTVISFAVSRPDDRLMAWALLILTVLVAIVPILIRNISHAMRRKE